MHDKLVKFSINLTFHCKKNHHEILLISTSRLMIVYGLGRNIALGITPIQTALKSFNQPPSTYKSCYYKVQYCISTYEYSYVNVFETEATNKMI